MHISKLIAVACCLGLTACSGASSTKVASLQKSDKSLSCSQVMLEINEAEFYRKEARTNKSPGFSTLISPISYMSSYMDADEAEKAADGRIDYLNRIYEINKCDSQPVQATYQQPVQQAQPMPVVQYVPAKPQMMQAMPAPMVPQYQMVPQAQTEYTDEVLDQTSALESAPVQPYAVAQYAPVQYAPQAYDAMQQQYMLYYY